MTSISVVSNASTAERGALTGILSGQLDIETTLAQSRLYHQQGDQKLALQTFLTAWNTLESNNGPIETAQAFSEEARERGAAEISADLTAGKSKLTTSIVLSLLMVAAIIGAQVLISRRQKTGVSVWLALAAIVTMANTVQWTMNYYTVQATIEKTSPALVLQMQRAAEYGSLVSALGAATAVQQLDPVAGSARIDAKIPKLAGFYNSNGRDSVQLTCLSQSFLDRVPQGDSCPVTNGVLIDLLPLNRTDLPGEWEYLSGATKAIAELLEASPEEQQKAYGVLLSNRQVLANLYQSEFDNQTEMATNTLRSANPLGLSAGSRVFLVATLLVIGFVRELARYH
jgi:hypothetical protein